MKHWKSFKSIAIVVVVLALHFIAFRAILKIDLGPVLFQLISPVVIITIYLAAPLDSNKNAIMNTLISLLSFSILFGSLAFFAYRSYGTRVQSSLLSGHVITKTEDSRYGENGETEKEDVDYFIPSDRTSRRHSETIFWLAIGISILSPIANGKLFVLAKEKFSLK